MKEKKITRRQFTRMAAATGGALALPWRVGPFGAKSAYAQAPTPYIPGGSLPPSGVTKYLSPLVKPPVLPRKSKVKSKGAKNAEYYEIAVKQFMQQILPPGHPQTAVWSYGPADAVPTLANRYFYPAFTIENKFNKPTVVKWVNGLGSAPHLLPVDQTLHWANPAGTPDTHGTSHDPYMGPVPIVTHVHGAHTYEESDGYPEAWYLADGSAAGSLYNTFKAQSEARLGIPWAPGSAVFDYPNDQRATTLWYHDHSLGMTRLNVYAGPAGFWLIRGGPDDMVLDSRDGTTAILPGPAPGKGIDPFGTFYEIPIAIQDRSFNADGSLFYPDNRAFFEGLDPGQLQIPFWDDPACTGPSDVPPIWQPEFFGNMMVVNGQTWPFLDVEQRRYRFRLLNGCNSRFLILNFSGIPGAEVWQIGAEGGFLAQPVNVTALNGGQILMSPAERADIIVDFTNVPQGSYILTNDGPDEPFGGGMPNIDFAPADPGSTGQVMEFRVGPAVSADMTTPPMFLQMPAIPAVNPAAPIRQVSLNEEESKTVNVIDDGNGNVVLACGDPNAAPFGPTAALLGTVNNAGPAPQGTSQLWSDPVTENPAVGATETWEIHNFTADAHPIHIHLVQFQVVGREAAGGGPSIAGSNLPLPTENGYKDTVIAYPGEITRVQARFDKAGLFVWHCHIVEHEDNEMMRPYRVL
jgi:FtsP/CotA-like multicopper oxidase with cupredoxin domain